MSSLPCPPLPTKILTRRCEKTVFFRLRQSSARKLTSRASPSMKPFISNRLTILRAFGPPPPKELHWFKPWDKVLEWNLPWAKWFVGGKLNLSYNCVDRHALGARATKPRIIWEGEPGEIRTPDLCASCTSKCKGLPTL